MLLLMLLAFRLYIIIKDLKEQFTLEGAASLACSATMLIPFPLFWVVGPILGPILFIDDQRRRQSPPSGLFLIWLIVYPTVLVLPLAVNLVGIFFWPARAHRRLFATFEEDWDEDQKGLAVQERTSFGSAKELTT